MLVAAAPPTLAHTRRTARPIVALARQPGPKQPVAQLTSSPPRRASSTGRIIRDAARGRRALAVVLLVLAPLAARADAVRGTDIVAVDDFIDAPRALFGRTRAAVERTLGAPASVRPRVLPA